MKLRLGAIIISAILLIAIAGCAQSATTGNNNINGSQGINNPAALPGNGGSPSINETPPPAIPEQQGPATVTIGEILDKANGYQGKDIIIEGKIVNECGAGCWFNLQDASGIVYVDLAPSNLAIPQKVGSKAKVYGVVAERNGVLYVIGNKVEF
jgi:uncharacterized protein YdeI (BOF family)